MSTSEQNGEEKLTRKQLRELRLTASTPVITEEESPEDAAPESAPAVEPPQPVAVPATEQKVAVTPEPAHEPMTRRQAREQERARTASVPVPEPAAADEADASVAAPKESDVPPVGASPDAAHEANATETPETVAEVEAAPEAGAEADGGQKPDAAPAQVASVAPSGDAPGRPTVSSAFGRGVRETAPGASIPQLFDDLIDGSGGSQHTAPNAMIFNPGPTTASLSGPVAATGELLITGSYELAEGIGSRGHARGTTDGKDVDAVLIDGELPPTSSPTPIAASSAVSTSKPAGEVIRPPAPETGNKLMFTLAIVAGGLALALAAVLVVAFTMNVF